MSQSSKPKNIPTSIPYVSKSIANRKEYLRLAKARWRAIKRQENEELFLKKQIQREKRELKSK